MLDDLEFDELMDLLEKVGMMDFEPDVLPPMEFPPHA